MTASWRFCWGATSGELYVLDGTTGRNVGPFPYQTQGRIMAPILPTRLRPGRALQLVFPSYDGHLYVVDGLTGESALIVECNIVVTCFVFLPSKGRRLLAHFFGACMLLSLEMSMVSEG